MFFVLSHLDTNSLTMSMESVFFFLFLFLVCFCCCIMHIAKEACNDSTSPVSLSFVSNP